VKLEAVIMGLFVKSITLPIPNIVLGFALNHQSIDIPSRLSMRPVRGMTDFGVLFEATGYRKLTTLIVIGLVHSMI